MFSSSTLSIYLLFLVMDEKIIKDINERIPWYIIFNYNDNIEKNNKRLEEWIIG